LTLNTWSSLAAGVVPVTLAAVAVRADTEQIFLAHLPVAALLLNQNLLRRG
jgi:hypothetical protein